MFSSLEFSGVQCALTQGFFNHRVGIGTPARGDRSFESWPRHGGESKLVARPLRNSKRNLELPPYRKGGSPQPSRPLDIAASRGRGRETAKSDHDAPVERQLAKER